MAVIEITRAVNLTAPVVPEGLTGGLYATEHDAHQFIITAYRGETEIALDGQVTGTFIRADGATVELTGSVVDGKATITLEASCYVVQGRFNLTVFNTGVNGAKAAIYRLTDDVVWTTTDTIVDPGSVVPDITDITAEYTAMQAATAAATAAAGSAAGAQVGLGPYNSLDVVGLCPKTSATANDVTFTWNALGQCVVSGTASGGSTGTNPSVNNIWSQATMLPPGMVAGGKYKVTYKSSASTSGVWWQLRWYYNGTEDTANPVYPADGGVLTVPDTATGVRMRLGVNSGTAISPAETITLALVDDHDYRTRGAIADGADLDDYKTPGYYVLLNGATYTNGPVSGAMSYPMELEVLPVTTNTTLQRVTDPYTAQTYTRVSQVSGSSIVWNNWYVSPAKSAVDAVTATADAAFQQRGALAAGDLDGVTTEGHYQLVGSREYTHLPWSEALTYPTQMEIMTITGGRVMQRITDPTTGEVYVRQSTNVPTSGTAATFGGWMSVNARHLLGKYVAFGDSLMYGAVWSPDVGGTLHQCAENLRIPTRIARAVGAVNDFANEAIGGIGYVKKQGGQNLVDQITGYGNGLANVELITIHAGANDKKYVVDNTPLGTLDAICSAIQTIITFLKTNYPKVQLVIIQPLPSGYDATYDPWSKKGSCGWSMNDFDERVSELCRTNHVGYVNWNGCMYCDTWAERNVGHNGDTEADPKPNYTHPVVDEDYALLGDFIAGKVAAYGQNGASIPVPPTTNGTYRLTATVSGGAVAYSWEATT